MADATVTISDYADYYNGTYRSSEIDLDTSDPDNPFLRVWLDPEDQQEDYGYRLSAPHSPAEPVSPVSTPTEAHGETGEAQEGCELCGGTGVVPGSEDYDPAVHAYNPTTGEPCDCQLGGAR